MQNLLGEGVLSASFIPVYARLRAEGRHEEAGRLAGAIAGLLIALTGVISVVGMRVRGAAHQAAGARLHGRHATTSPSS